MTWWMFTTKWSVFSTLVYVSEKQQFMKHEEKKILGKETTADKKGINDDLFNGE